MVVGPLYPDPIRAVREFSREMRVNMINPLSSNEEYIGDNPFAYLFRPGYTTMARQLATYAAQLHDNPYALVYFSPNERDSLFATSYRQVLESYGKEVLAFSSLDELQARALLDTLTEQFEEYYPKHMLDSLTELEGRFIKTRRMRTEEEEAGWEDPEVALPWFYEKDEDGNVLDDSVKVVAYENKFTVVRDSIGSIMIASRSNTIINNIISALAAREDSTGVYGYGDWFDFKVVNYELLERLQVKLALPEHLDRSSYRYDDLTERFTDSYRGLPSEFHYHGYEFAMFLGDKLHRYGKYFQNGFLREGKMQGIMTPGYDFSGTNDNQVVPIVTIRNYNIELVEPPSIQSIEE